jgi:hypothetical protein
MALTRSLAATIVVSCTAFDAKDMPNTVPKLFQPTILNDGLLNLKDDCAGCRSEERLPDSELWDLFNSSGKVLKKQAEHAAQAMGLNAHFEDFVPVRYADQWVSGQRFFIKVRVEPETFMDIAVVLGLPSSNKKPTLEGIKVGVSEEARIDDFEESPPPIHPPHDKGSRSEERVPDSQIWELFNSSGKALQKKAEHQAQAMGLNAHWEEFTPVRYAEQMVSGQRLFIKVRVEPQTFIDMVVVLGLPSSNTKPMLEGIKVGVSEEDAIDDFEESPIPFHPPHDKGSRSEERVPDSQIWELFNSSGKALQKKAEHQAQAMGLNAHWEEFVPVRYAEQMVSGQRLFIKVRVEPQTFIDMVVVLGLPSSNKQPTLEEIKVGVSEEAPIDDFEESPTGLDEDEDDCDGCASEERVPDADLWEVFNSSTDLIQDQALLKARAMGWNGHFKEFVPVRYAVQSVAGQRFYIKVRVQSQLFIDVVLFVGLSASDAEPVVEGIKLDVDEQAPIDDFQTAAAAAIFV